MTWSAGRKLTAGFALALAILAANALFSYRNTWELVKDGRWVVHTLEVLNRLDELSSTIKDVETRQHAYLIIGEESAAAEFEADLARIGDEIRNLKEATADNGPQQARIGALEGGVREYVTALREAINVRRREGFPAAQRALLSGRLLRAKAGVQGPLAEIRSAEAGLLTLRTDKARSSIYRTVTTFTVATALALVLMGGTFFLIRKYLDDRDRSEATLRESELRVRTLLDSTGEGIYGIDTSGLCTFSNAAALKMLGYADASDLLGKDMHPLIHHSLPDGTPFPAQDCPIYRTSRMGEAHHGEEVFWRADGSSFPVEIRSYPILREGVRQGTVVTFLDISGRRRSEQAMRVRDRALRAISQGIVISDPSQPDEPIIYANATFEQITGYSEAEALGRNCRFLQGPDTDPAAIGLIREAIRERRECAVDLLNYRKDGTPFWNSLTIAPVSDSAGRVTHFVGVQTDITDRKRDEEQLRRSEQRFRSLVEATSAIVWSLPTSGDFVEEQPGWAAFTGQSFDEYKGHGWLDAVHPDDRERTALAWEDASSRRVTYLSEHRLRRADGEYRQMSARAVPILAPDGDVLEWVGIHSDVTEKKLAEEARRETEERFRIMADSIPQLAWMARPDGQIFWYNKRWYEYTGSTPREMEGWGWQATHDPSELPRVVANLKAAFAAVQPWEDTFPIRRHDGEMRWHLSRALPVRDESGKVVRWFGTNTDITEQRQVEESLRQAKEAAEAASRSKSTFLANMSHELRTPLNAIIGYSEMLEEEAADLGRDDFVADLGKVHAAGKHLLGLINDVLDLSKIEAGKMELYLETFEVSEMLDGVVSTIEPLAEKSGDTLHVECPTGLGAMHADLTKIRQSLLNLLSNAVKFTDHGQITLRASRETAGARDWISLEVSDSGIGMTPDQLARLFQPFTQADASTTRKYGGTGLGLTITRRFCQLMGGEVTVRSEPGRGSTFTIRVPARVAEVRPEATPALPPSLLEDQDGQLVMVVDDDPAVRDVMGRLLRKEGFRVSYAADGDEALLRARQDRPDVITLDVMMPGLDGWAVLTALKSDPEMAEIPVIMITFIGDRNLGFTLGASDYLSKPIDRVRLSKVLKKYRKGRPGGRALVVDDDADARGLMRKMLEDAGWSVDEAEDGRAGLERAAAMPHDLIILDLTMPRMDGFEFATALRKSQGGQEVPILVVTSRDLSTEERSRLSGKVQAILQKGSYSRDDLLSEVRRGVAEGARRRLATASASAGDGRSS